MTQYTFNCKALAIGDIRTLFAAETTNDMVGLLGVIARCLLIEVFALPIAEMTPLMQQFGAGLTAYIQQARTAHDDAGMPEAMRLLRGLFGEGEQ